MLLIINKITFYGILSVTLLLSANVIVPSAEAFSLGDLNPVNLGKKTWNGIKTGFNEIKNGIQSALKTIEGQIITVGIATVICIVSSGNCIKSSGNIDDDTQLIYDQLSEHEIKSGDFEIYIKNPEISIEINSNKITVTKDGGIKRESNMFVYDRLSEDIHSYEPKSPRSSYWYEHPPRITMSTDGKKTVTITDSRLYYDQVSTFIHNGEYAFTLQNIQKIDKKIHHSIDIVGENRIKLTTTIENDIFESMFGYNVLADIFYTIKEGYHLPPDPKKHNTSLSMHTDEGGILNVIELNPWGGTVSKFTAEKMNFKLVSKEKIPGEVVSIQILNDSEVIITNAIGSYEYTERFLYQWNKDRFNEVSPSYKLPSYSNLPDITIDKLDKQSVTVTEIHSDETKEELQFAYDNDSGKFDLKEKRIDSVLIPLSYWNNHGKGYPDEGDPLVFSLTGKSVNVTRNWSEQHKSLLTEFDLYDIGEKVTLSRTLDDGTMTLFLDLNGDGELSNGTEWLYDQNENVYEILSKQIIDSNQNGWFDYSDSLWSIAMIKDGDKYYSTSELGIVAFNWSNAVKGHGDMFGENRQYSDCLYEGKYLYPDCITVSNNHFAIMAYNHNSILLNDGRILDSFGSLMGHLDMSESREK